MDIIFGMGADMTDREEFYNAFPKFAGLIELEEAGSISHLDAIAARHCFAVWQAAKESSRKELEERCQSIDRLDRLLQEANRRHRT